MSFFVRMHIQGEPVLFSDTFVDSTTAKKDHQVARLCQKVSLISRRRALVWCGSIIEARHLCSQLRKSTCLDYLRFSNRACDVYRELSDISFILIQYEAGRWYETGFGDEDADLGSWGKVNFGGSGGRAIFGLLSHTESESPDTMSFDNTYSPVADHFLRPVHIEASILSECLSPDFTYDLKAGAFVQTTRYISSRFCSCLPVLYYYFEFDSHRYDDPILVFEKRFSNITLFVRLLHRDMSEVQIFRIPEVLNYSDFDFRTAKLDSMRTDRDFEYVVFIVRLKDVGALRTLYLSKHIFGCLVDNSYSSWPLRLKSEPTKLIMREQFGTRVTF